MATETDRGLLSRSVDNAVRYPGAVYTLLFYVATAAFVVFALFPLYWLVLLSVTPDAAMYDMGFVPGPVTLGNYVGVVGFLDFLRFVFNSLVIAGLTTVVVVVVASVTGYAFGRLDFPGRGPLLIVTLCVAYFPPAAFLIPLFELFTGNVALVLGPVRVTSPELFNTPGSIVAPLSALTMPLAIFILTTFFRSIPDTLEDAARVEGTTRLGALVRVVAPLSRPGIATAAVLTFLQVYNEFFFSLLMTDGDPRHWAPIVPALYDLNAANAGLAAAGSVVALLPVVVLFLLADEQIASGLSDGFGGLKG